MGWFLVLKLRRDQESRQSVPPWPPSTGCDTKLKVVSNILVQIWTKFLYYKPLNTLPINVWQNVNQFYNYISRAILILYEIFENSPMEIYEFDINLNLFVSRTTAPQSFTKRQSLFLFWTLCLLVELEDCITTLVVPSSGSVCLAG